MPDGSTLGVPGTAQPLRVLFASSEAYPLAKSGGLADVSAALPATLRRLGVDIRVIIPGYEEALDRLEAKRAVGMLEGQPGGQLVEGRMPDTGLPVYLYDAPALFRRPGLYQDSSGQDWHDNHLRFAAFCHAASSIALGRAGLTWRPQVVHANDWHAGLVPAILAAHGARRPATVFTVHNLAFQGNFPFHEAGALGLPWEMMTVDGLEFYGQVSFLKAGIRFGDKLTTVSPTYAREILTPAYGCGMEGLLQARSRDLTGILNGADYGVWDPAVDKDIAQRYSADELDGKNACKRALQERMGLERTNAPVIAFTNRLTYHKMADVVLQAMPALLEDGAQFVLHGQGDKGLEATFMQAAGHRPSRMAVRIGYDEALARQVTAAADISLTAARFEPCGLTTMYAMRYGALPVTRKVGGLVDMMTDADSCSPADGGATGFLFDGEAPADMVSCLRRAIHWFRERDWKGLQRSAMRRNFGWERSAHRYLDLYRGLAAPSMPETGEEARN